MKKVILLFYFVTLTIYSQIPAGYYDTATGTNYALKTQLYNVIKGHTDNAYGGLWVTYLTSDVDIYYENDGTVLDMYSEVHSNDGNSTNDADPYNFTYGPLYQDDGSGGSAEGQKYNREHIVPQSIFKEFSPMRNDAHFIPPTDKKVNNVRSNYPHGMVGTTTYTSENGSKLGSALNSGYSAGYSGTVFEPIDEFKGDIARMYFYFATRYENVITDWGVSFDMFDGTTDQVFAEPFLTILMTWHTNDPVSTREIDRNDAIYARQNNRNPFIDHPEYVAQIWSTTTDTEDPTAPTNLIAANITNTTVDLNWTASTDDVGVTSYDIFVDDTYNSTTAATSYTVTGLSPTTLYSFTVSAKDVATNESEQSLAVNGTTTATPSFCGSETFTESNAPSGGSYATDNFIGDNEVTWAYVESRDDGGYQITGKGLMLRNTSSKLTSSTVANGIGDFTCSLLKGFTGGGSRQVSLYINGILKGTSIAWDNTTVQTFTVTDINITGNIVIEIKNATGNQVVIDDISWSCYAGTPDTEAPSTITDVSSSNTTSTTTDLAWTAATDNVGVTSYEIYKDDVLLATSPTISYNVTGLSASTSYNFTVKAKDAADNVSLVSNTAAVTTTAVVTGVNELFISEYVEGSNFNKAIEIANFTGSSVDLSIYSLKRNVNGGNSWGAALPLEGTLIDGGVFVVANSASNATILAIKDLDSDDDALKFNGDDPIGLFKNGTLIDLLGEFNSSTVYAEDVTLRRKPTISSPNTTYTESEWDPFTTDTFSGLGAHTLSSLAVQTFVENLFNMYPNPTNSNSATIRINSAIELTHIQLYNTIGQLVIAIINPKIRNNRLEINNIPNGMYIVKIQSDTSYSTKRLVVQ